MAERVALPLAVQRSEVTCGRAPVPPNCTSKCQLCRRRRRRQLEAQRQFRRSRSTVLKKIIILLFFLFTR